MIDSPKSRRRTVPTSKPLASRSTMPQHKGTTSRQVSQRAGRSPYSIPAQDPHAQDPHLQDATAIWKECALESQRSDVLVIAVVHPQQEQYVKDSRRSEPNMSGRCAQRILICTASALQDVIERVVNKRHHTQCDKLSIVVSSAIESIFYQIDSFIKNVYIKVCGTIRSNTRYKLRIDEKSTYCSHPSDSWLYSELSAAGTHELTHFNGIYFPHRERDDNHETEALDLDREGMLPEFKAEDEEEILKKLEKVKIAYEQTSSSVAPDAPPRSPPDTPRAGNGPGFFKALLSAVVGIVSGLGAAGGVVWLNTSGVFINGPLGFRLAVGYASAGVAGGACAAGMGVGAGAGAAIYLIPWDLLWRIIKLLFARFWGCVCDLFAWLWEKIKALPSWFGSWF